MELDAFYLSQILVFALAFSDEVVELRCKKLGGHFDLWEEKKGILRSWHRRSRGPRLLNRDLNGALQEGCQLR